MDNTNNVSFEIYKGPIEDLLVLSERVWDKAYKNKIRHDLFNKDFIQVTQNSCKKFTPYILKSDNEIAALFFSMEFEGLIGGKKGKIAFASWLTALKGLPEKKHSALILLNKVKEHLKNEGIDVFIGLLDTQTRSTAILYEGLKEDEILQVLPSTTPLVKIMGKELLKDIRAKKTEVMFFKLINGFSLPKENKSSLRLLDISADEINICEQHLKMAQNHKRKKEETLEINYDNFPYILKAPQFQKALKIVDLKESGKVLAYFHLLEIDLIGEQNIQSHIIERSWFAQGARRKCMKVFLDGIYKRGIKIVMMPQSFSKRNILASLSTGFLPDIERPQRAFVLSLNKEFHEEVKKIKYHNMIFR